MANLAEGLVRILVHDVSFVLVDSHPTISLLRLR